MRIAHEKQGRRQAQAILAFGVKRFPLVAKEFRYDANANQKLCIALRTNDRAPLH
jgi:hypothetical protein